MTTIRAAWIHPGSADICGGRAERCAGRRMQPPAHTRCVRAFFHRRRHSVVPVCLRPICKPRAHLFVPVGPIILDTSQHVPAPSHCRSFFAFCSLFLLCLHCFIIIFFRSILFLLPLQTLALLSCATVGLRVILYSRRRCSKKSLTSFPGFPTVFVARNSKR